MAIEAQVTIDAPKEKVWDVITNIEHASENISGIEKVEVLEKPIDGIVGLKWRETRTMFGQTATEVMWITDAEENECYRTRAESHGSVYTTDFVLSEQDGKTRLSMEFDAVPQTLGSRLMWTLTGWFFRGSTKKGLMQDLVDIKAAAERAA